jgi:hypothetical protein
MFKNITFFMIAMFPHCRGPGAQRVRSLDPTAILWRPVLVVEEAGVPGENHQPLPSNW